MRNKRMRRETAVQSAMGKRPFAPFLTPPKRGKMAQSSRSGGRREEVDRATQEDRAGAWPGNAHPYGATADFTCCLKPIRIHRRERGEIMPF
ncbi:MAG: hypothetical protein KC421_05040 [Anaerolineales bacterium]|nr:hypothetical protein [Anaerolineales bacterium]